MQHNDKARITVTGYGRDRSTFSAQYVYFFAKTARQTDFPGVNVHVKTLSWLLVMVVIEVLH